MNFLPTDKPEFCIIAPTSYLSYTAASNTHLVLAHIVDKDWQYCNFYRKLSDRGDDRIIMDNGAFELGKPYDPDKLIELAHMCGAHAIVLPDYPGQKSQLTIDAATTYAPIFKSNGFSTMYVPQSQVGDYSDWYNGYMWTHEEGNDLVDIIGMSILALPNAMPHIPKSYVRVVITELLQRTYSFNKNKYHHYLGLNSGPALEIPALIRMKALNSCDSSNPVWMAILGHEYSYNTDSYLAVSKVKKEVDFSMPVINDGQTNRRILRNIDMTLELFK